MRREIAAALLLVGWFGLLWTVQGWKLEPRGTGEPVASPPTPVPTPVVSGPPPVPGPKGGGAPFAGLASDPRLWEPFPALRAQEASEPADVPAVPWPPRSWEDWAARRLNPGKWVMENVAGALVGIVQEFNGRFWQLIRWSYGVEPLDGEMWGEAEATEGLLLRAQGDRKDTWYAPFLIPFGDGRIFFDRPAYRQALGFLRQIALGILVFALVVEGARMGIQGKISLREGLERYLLALFLIFAGPQLVRVLSLASYEVTLQLIAAWRQDGLRELFVASTGLAAVGLSALFLEPLSTFAVVVLLAFLLSVLFFIFRLLERLFRLLILALVAPLVGALLALRGTEAVFTRWLQELIRWLLWLPLAYLLLFLSKNLLLEDLFSVGPKHLLWYLLATPILFLVGWLWGADWIFGPQPPGSLLKTVRAQLETAWKGLQTLMEEARSAREERRAAASGAMAAATGGSFAAIQVAVMVAEAGTSAAVRVHGGRVTAVGVTAWTG